MRVVLLILSGSSEVASWTFSLKEAGSNLLAIFKFFIGIFTVLSTFTISWWTSFHPTQFLDERPLSYSIWKCTSFQPSQFADERPFSTYSSCEWYLVLGPAPPPPLPPPLPCLFCQPINKQIRTGNKGHLLLLPAPSFGYRQNISNTMPQQMNTLILSYIGGSGSVHPQIFFNLSCIQQIP